MSRLPINVLLGVITAGKIIFFLLAWLVWRSHAQRAGKPDSPMIGLKGIAVTDFSEQGRVMVQGEYWWVRARCRIAAGEQVRITGLEGLLLEVEPCPDEAISPRPVSAIELRI